MKPARLARPGDQTIEAPPLAGDQDSTIILRQWST
jgi:hypothetical protein